MNNSLFQLLCETFPQIDVRLIKATVLEHGDNVELAMSFLKSESANMSDKSGQTEQTSRKDQQMMLESFTDARDEVDCYGCDISGITSLMDFAEDARADKDSVMKLIEEISVLRARADEESVAAEEARTQELVANKDILTKVESMQKEISMKQEINWVRESEIYGEKAVLASEAQELRLRLRKMKEKKEKAVAMLFEIKATLEERLETSLREKEVAEEEKRVRMEEVQKLLEIEDARMAIVNEESEKLDKEAEACIQTREFLNKTGSIVDSLQGEMCVVYEDVDLFKKQVEEGTQLSLNTVSLPLQVHPEVSYSFRKSSSISAASSQVLVRSLEASFSLKKSSIASSISSARAYEEYDHNNLDAGVNEGYLGSNNLGDYGGDNKRGPLSSASSNTVKSFSSHLLTSEVEPKYGCDVFGGAGDEVLHYFVVPDGVDSNVEHLAEHTPMHDDDDDAENSASFVSQSDEEWKVIGAKVL